MRRRKGSGSIRLHGRGWQIRYPTIKGKYFAETIHGSREYAETVLERRLQDIGTTRIKRGVDNKPIGWERVVKDHPKPIRKFNRRKLPPNLRWRVLSRDNFTCVYCSYGKDDGVQLEVDHTIPVALGGDDSFDNLKTTCIECNRGKGTRTLKEVAEA